MMLEALLCTAKLDRKDYFGQYILKPLSDYYPELPQNEALTMSLAEKIGIDVFLLALENVTKTQGGVAELAKKTNKSRTSLYKLLSKNGNPYLKNIYEILSAMGLHLAVTAK